MAPIIIAGAGPGGLTAAVAMHRLGLPVLLLERAPELRTAGAGLTVQANAMRMLAAIGLRDAVTEAGEVLREGTIQTDAGAVLSRVPFDVAGEKLGVPGVGIHRGALARVLADCLPEDAIRFDAEVVHFTQDKTSVVVELADGAAIEGSALIGADGIHSVVRQKLFGDLDLRYSGYTCWRGISELSRPLGAGGMFERWGRGLRLGLVPIDAEQTYWFATRNGPAGGDRGATPKADLTTMFSGFASPVPELLAQTPESSILRNDIVDIAPIDKWVSGRVALMGDAAHAMTPNMGQGACQAIEDGVVLAACLHADQNAEFALRSYEDARKSRARQFVKRSWSIGRMGQWENGLARAFRNLMTRMTPDRLAAGMVLEAWDVAVPGVFEKRARVADPV